MRQSRNSTRQKERQTSDLMTAVQTDTDWNYSSYTTLIFHTFISSTLLCTHTHKPQPPKWVLCVWENVFEWASIWWAEKGASDELSVWSFTHTARHSVSYCRWMEFHYDNTWTTIEQNCTLLWHVRMHTTCVTDAMLHHVASWS